MVWLTLSGAFALNMMQITYILSGQYTLISHASIFSNLGGPSIVIYRFTRREPIHTLEYFGLLSSFVGCVLTVSDKEVEKVDPTT